MAHLFITRALEPGDALVGRLRAAGHRVTGHALLRFTALPPGEIPATDWVFAYSATGVTLMDDATVARLRRTRPRVAAMGRRTAGAFAARGFAVDFEGAGSPDILGCLDGRFLGIEVKTPTGKQEQSQRRFQTAFEAAGGIYLIARSPAEAVEAITRAVAARSSTAA